MKVIDKIPLWFFILAAIAMAVAPYPAEPQPHLVQKIQWLLAGKLTGAVDIFDLFFHGILFPSLLVIKLIRIRQGSKPSE